MKTTVSDITYPVQYLNLLLELDIRNNDDMDTFCLHDLHDMAERGNTLFHSDYNYLLYLIEEGLFIDKDAAYEVVSNMAQAGVVTTVELTPMTDIQRKIMSELDTYCHRVITSHALSGHGKSWEPFVSLSFEGDHIISIGLSSYQAGDKEEWSGSEEHLLNCVRKHNNVTKDMLLMGTTHSNPFVSSLIDPASPERACDIYEGICGKHPHIMSRYITQDGCLLPIAVSSTGKNVVVEGKGAVVGENDYSPFRYSNHDMWSFGYPCVNESTAFLHHLYRK